jgi:sulfatase maturation enzyme AslB (radical SAM superfamily)
MSDQKEYYKKHNYNDTAPVYVDATTLRADQQDRLINSKVFCILPWIHLHAFPNGQAYPCCLSESDHPVGNLHDDTMREVWNSPAYKQMRVNMLNEKPCKECTKCYEREEYGFVSMRNDSNKNFGHHIALVDQTEPDGTFKDFKLRYYDIRFSNLCNMSCRTCGSWFSSSWYNEEVKLFGKRDHPQFMYAGKDSEDMWTQMQEHIPYLEQIYFAGGEPLIMEEHYRTLKELVARQMFDVRLIYNTNFSRLSLKGDSALDYWRQFKNVSIGASLDAMGPRAEYIRKGTIWADIEDNRQQMLEQIPDTDFYVSSTVSIMNAWHITDFHRAWVEQGLIQAQDWNINILQGPDRMRVDVLPAYYKDMIRQKIEQHIEWLRPQDHLTRAVGGFEGIIKFMYQEDRSHLLGEFFEYTDKLDASRDEKFETVFPEYKDLRSYVTA